MYAVFLFLVSLLLWDSKLQEWKKVYFVHCWIPSDQRREANIHGTISLQWWIVATAFIVWENDEVLVAQISPYFLLSSICINISINTLMVMVDADWGQQDLKFFKALIPEVLSA